MKLSRAERWILANQYRILELLEPDEAASYQRIRTALEEGLQSAIDNYAEHIYRDEYTMSEEECSEVVRIMSMYDALQRSVGELKGQGEISAEQVRFPGFDGNNETKQMGYARYVVEEEGRFAYLDRVEDLNSHFPSLEAYRRMLNEWKRHDDSYQLTTEQVRAILGARRHPGG